MIIRDFTKKNRDLVYQAALLLVEGFKDMAPLAWPDINSALDEVNECMEEGRICKAAIGDDGSLLGWIGGISQYGGNVWELHPLVVRAEMRKKGIGRVLVLDFEMEVKR